MVGLTKNSYRLKFLGFIHLYPSYSKMRGKILPITWSISCKWLLVKIRFSDLFCSRELATLTWRRQGHIYKWNHQCAYSLAAQSGKVCDHELLYHLSLFYCYGERRPFNFQHTVLLILIFPNMETLCSFHLHILIPLFLKNPEYLFIYIANFILSWNSLVDRQLYCLISCCGVFRTEMFCGFEGLIGKH